MHSSPHWIVSSLRPSARREVKVTTRRDDRVHPGHARKMAAKLQAMGYPALFYEPPAGGHGYGKDNGEVASFSALGSAFLRRAIGWETP